MKIEKLNLDGKKSSIEVLDKMLSLSNYMAINMQISRNKLELSY